MEKNNKKTAYPDDILIYSDCCIAPTLPIENLTVCSECNVECDEIVETLEEYDERKMWDRFIDEEYYNLNYRR